MPTVWMFYEAEKHIEAGPLSFREMVSMSKEEAVALMTDFIVMVNLNSALQQGLNEDQAERLIDDMLPNLKTINEDLYDLLVDNGVIA